MLRKDLLLKGLGVLSVILVLTITLIACDQATTPQHTLSIQIEGEGSTNFSPGGNTVDEGVIELSANPDEGYEFYRWEVEGEYEVNNPESEDTSILVEEDLQITVWFSRPEDNQEVEIEPRSFLGAAGTAEDLTNHPPYPPGFEIELKAEPEDPEEHTFLNWGIEYLEEESAGTAQAEIAEAADPGRYFEDPEDPHTNFEVPGRRARVIPYFSTEGDFNDPGDFDYDHNDFDFIKVGEYGRHYDFWDLSEVEAGEEINFYFHARNIPDRFKVYYGNEEEWHEGSHEFELIFNSHWVSMNPDNFVDPSRYQPDPQVHDWHEEVEHSNRITFRDQPGGKYEAIIEKEAVNDVLMIEIEGRDDGTIWDYVVDEN